MCLYQRCRYDSTENSGRRAVKTNNARVTLHPVQSQRLGTPYQSLHNYCRRQSTKVQVANIILLGYVQSQYHYAASECPKTAETGGLTTDIATAKCSVHRLTLGY